MQKELKELTRHVTIEPLWPLVRAPDAIYPYHQVCDAHIRVPYRTHVYRRMKCGSADGSMSRVFARITCVELI